MTTSHLSGFFVFGMLALAGIAGWVISNKHPAVTGDPKMVRKVRWQSVILVLLGVVLGYAAFTITHRLARTTLYEVMAEGSIGVELGTSAPVRNLVFNVEHPGVEHVLMLCPKSKLFRSPWSAVEVLFSLHGPAGEALIPKRTERFRVEGNGPHKSDWEAKRFDFTPAAAGSHTLQVIPITIGIPGIHIRVEDPLKRDGQRAAGY